MGFLPYLLVPLAVYGLLVAFLYLNQRNMMFHPDPTLPPPAAVGVGDMAAVRVTTADGLDLTGWYKPAQPGRATVLYFHGNGGNIGYRAFKARRLLDAGYGVLLAGYRGYGGNPGQPGEEGFHADARAALAFLGGRGVAPADVVLYGESLGTGVAVRLAAETAKTQPVAAVVLEAPYDSIAEVAAAHYPYVPVGMLLKDRFESAGRVAAIGAPLLVVHGEQDGVVPVAHGLKLFKAAVAPKEAEWFPDAAHNDLYDHGAGERILAFLDRVTGGGKNQ
ncbi:MAG: alpha/beta hydrolase [Hyphomicrobiales bacterium]|nr:alpha/beta hydrolase [Hyphomicrobiales bacterium]MCP5372720.1 alpha/beta hydrolase [Hyphomicrobiales bacterium]